MKKELKTKVLLNPLCFKILLMINWIFIFTFLFCIRVSATSYSQNVKVSIDIENMELKKALSVLEEKGNIRLLYSEESFPSQKEVSIKAKNVRVLEVLKQLLKDTDLKFKAFDEGLVVITPENREIQEVRINGTVRDVTGESLPGVSVKIKGTSTVTATDAEGRFTINAPDGNVVLVFTYIGYTPQEIPVEGQTELNVTLKVQPTSLNEVIVVGYGTQKRKDLVGSVGVASAKDFGDVAVSTTSQLIQGKVAGVQVVNNTGLPGSGANIIVRGTGSFTNTTPLYVIDNIQSDANTFNALSPFDIQDITVLKDASSVAIYGAQAANGVVIITTRKAKTGAPKVSYSGYYGQATPWKKLDLLNASQYIDFVKDYGVSTNTTLPAKLNTAEVLVDRTDWQNAVFRNANLTEHFVNISGGTEKVTYSVSTGYTDQQSIEVGYDFKRYNLRVNTEEKIGSRIKLGQNLNIRYSIVNGIAPSFGAMVRMAPYAPIYDANNLGGFSMTTTPVDLNDNGNPLTEVYRKDKKDKDLLNYGQLFGEIDILKGLKFRSQFGLTFTNFNSYNFTDEYRNSNNLLYPTGITESYQASFKPIIENYLSFNREFGIHSLGATLGNSYQGAGRFRQLDVSGADFSNSEIHSVGAASKSSITRGAANSGRVFISYFGRLNYTLLDKYILSASIRRDASSAFGPENRVGYFPAVGLGWKLSEENFIKAIPAISELKLRASYGKTGNSNIRSFLFQSNVYRGTGNNIVYALGDGKSLVQGATLAETSNAGIQWEETQQSDLGVDLGLWSNKLTFSLGFYNRDSKGLLVGVPYALSAGYGGIGGIESTIITNAASASNQGIEFSSGLNNTLGKLRYSISLNIAHNKNEVTSLGTENATPIVKGGFEAVASMSRTAPGQPIGAFYGYKVDHVAIDAADVTRYNDIAKSKTGKADALYQASLLPGDIIFKDIDGDGMVTEKDQTFLGDPNPTWNYGTNINLGYKRFDLMVSLQGIAGVKIVNGLRYWTEGMTRPFNSSTDVLRRWKKDGDVTDIPRAGQNINGSLNLRPSDRFIESGSFMRVRNVTVGYAIPETALKAISSKGISSARFYLTAQNLFTFTKYSGYDPEISSMNNNAADPNSATSLIFERGIDLGQYPQPRTFMLGVQVGF